MFKRANKVTALLVAAASVMATVPAMAADSVRLGNKEGTIKQGVAFGDGSYAYYGYRTDSDDTGIYYNNDGGSTKEKLDSDLEDYRLDNDSKYGTKYVYAKESSNNDEYLIDLSSGKINEDSSAETKMDNAKSKLVSNLKRADRYDDIINRTGTFDNTIDANNASFDQILKGQFGDVWYQYSVTTTSGVNYISSTTNAGAHFSYEDVKTGNTTTTTQARYIGFTNESGKYIDLSEDTNMRVYSTYTGRAEWIKEYGEKNKDSKLTVDLIKVDAVAQDKDNIYAIATVKVTDDNASVVQAAHDAAIAAGKTGKDVPQLAPTTQYFLQKISKTQGSKDDGEAYTSKEITSYQLQSSHQNNMYDNDDFYKAFDMLMGEGDQANEELLGITVKNNSLYVVRMEADASESEKLHVYKLDMGKYKEEALVGNKLGRDVDFNALKKDDDEDYGDIIDFDRATSDIDEGVQGLEEVVDRNKGTNVEIAGQTLYRMPSVSIDTNGVVWALEKGKVIKIDKLSKSTVYTVDRGMNAIDVYDENNLIIWDTDGDVYTNISEGKKVTEDDGLAVNPDQGKTVTVKVGWAQDATTGAWNFYDVNGTKTANYWAYDNGIWYWIKADGTMATGWIQDNTGTWYYLNPVIGGPLGSMYSNRWAQSASGAWYYLGSSGAMVCNQWIQSPYTGAWYYVGSDGTMASNRWIQSSYTGYWYYVGSDGAMVANTTINGYKIGADGVML